MSECSVWISEFYPCPCAMDKTSRELWNAWSLLAFANEERRKTTWGLHELFLLNLLQSSLGRHKWAAALGSKGLSSSRWTWLFTLTQLPSQARNPSEPQLHRTFPSTFKQDSSTLDFGPDMFAIIFQWIASWWRETEGRCSGAHWSTAPSEGYILAFLP